MIQASVIIPTYNRANLLKRAIDSALNQSVRSIEVICIDDASRDNTCSIVESISDSRFSYIRNKTNKNMPYSWWQGVHAAKSNWICFLGDDDVLDRHAIQTRLSAVNKENTVAVYSSRRLVWEDDYSESLRPPPIGSSKLLTPEEALRSALDCSWWIGSSLYSRDVLINYENQILSTGYTFDVMLNSRIAISMLGDIIYTGVPDVRNTRHAYQVSQQKRSQMYQGKLDVMRDLEHDLSQQGNSKLMKIARREHSNWDVQHGRTLMAEGNRFQGLGMITKGLKHDLTNRWALRQLLKYVFAQAFKIR